MPRHLRSRNPQSGQTLILLAFAVFVLAGMLGLVIDGGMAQNEKQQSQTAADGTSLAAAWNIEYNPGAVTLASVTAAANKVMTEDGLATSALAMSYYQGVDASGHCSGIAATSPYNAKCIHSAVSFPTATFFIRVLGPATYSVASSAEVVIPTRNSIACAFCFMDPSAAMHWSHSNVKIVNVTGAPSYNDSTAANAFQFDGNNTTMTSPAGIFMVSSTSPPGCYQGSANTFAPPPTCNQPTFTDPLANTPLPANPGGSHKTISAASCPSNICSAGIYDASTVSSGTWTLNPGVYIFDGALKITGGTLKNATSGGDGNGGVLLYLACSAYPTPCTNTGGNGQAGAYINQTGGTMTLAAASVASTYHNMLVFADRNDTSTNTLGQGATAETITGTWYALRMPLITTASSNVTFLGSLIVDTYNQGNPNYDFSITITYTFSSAYQPPAGYGTLARLDLSL